MACQCRSARRLSRLYRHGVRHHACRLSPSRAAPPCHVFQSRQEAGAHQNACRHAAARPGNAHKAQPARTTDDFLLKCLFKCHVLHCKANAQMPETFSVKCITFFRCCLPLSFFIVFSAFFLFSSSEKEPRDDQMRIRVACFVVILSPR